MPAITGAAMIGAAAIGAGGGMYANSQSAAAAKDSYKKRYQWQVKDLKAAGLNPMLSYMNPAPVPNQPRFENVGEAAVKGASSAMQIKSMSSQAKMMDEQSNLARATANKEAALGQIAEMDADIKRASPEYRDAKAVDRGFQGTSAGASERYTAGTEKMKSEAAAAKSVAEEAATNAQRAQNDYEFEKSMRPLELEHQRYVNKAKELGLSQAEADAQFYDLLQGWAKGSGLVAEAAKLYMMYLKAK